MHLSMACGPVCISAVDQLHLAATAGTNRMHRDDFVVLPDVEVLFAMWVGQGSTVSSRSYGMYHQMKETSEK